MSKWSYWLLTVCTLYTVHVVVCPAIVGNGLKSTTYLPTADLVWRLAVSIFGHIYGWFTWRGTYKSCFITSITWHRSTWWLLTLVSHSVHIEYLSVNCFCITTCLSLFLYSPRCSNMSFLVVCMWACLNLWYILVLLILKYHMVDTRFIWCCK